MAFDAELRAYLELVEEGAAPRPARVHQDIDEHQLRVHFLRRLRELEGTQDPDVVESVFREWSSRLEPLARYLRASQTALVSPEATAATRFAERVVDVLLGLSVDEVGLVERLELARIADRFLKGPSQDVETYAVEVGLIRQESDFAQLTPIGAAFLRLRGKDAIRWLLTAETIQSMGDYDPWRASRELLEMASEPAIPCLSPGTDHPFPFDPGVLERLSEMGVLIRSYDADGEIDHYYIADEWRDVIRLVVNQGPWHHAISAILEDDRARLVSATGTAIEAVVDQAKMIAHEVRNALVPARIRLDALRTVVPESEASKVDAVKRGVVRVLTFAEEMVATSELVAEPATSCDLAALVHEAVSWLDDGERVLVDVSSAIVRVRAPRTQLARSIANLVRNALQATYEGQAVRVAVHRQAETVRVSVDDAGPGVPEETRERVFHEGFTTRTDGSGYGLYQVRRVVVDGLRGRVWCEASDLGGARFVIELPEVEVER